MLKRNKNTKKLRFEGLESRNLMAGDVTAAVVDHVLQITGDIADNSIEIKQAGASWIVKGIGTTVNGNNSVQTFIEVTGIEIDLGAGDDLIKASKGTLSRDFEINDHDGGRTTVDLSKINARNINISTHDDADTITINNCFAISKIAVTSFATNDDRADRVTILKTKAYGIVVKTGSGDDVITVKDIESDGYCAVDASISGESDQDVVAISKSRFDNLEVDTADGSDAVTLGKIRTVHTIRIDATGAQDDSGVDIVSVTNSSSSDELHIYTGDGADVVKVAKSKFEGVIRITSEGTSADEGDTIVLTQIQDAYTSISSGADADRVTLTKAAAQYDHEIDMGGGDSDQLVITRSSGRDAVVNGGDQADDTVTFSRTKFRRRRVKGFESEIG